jgi:hypothetical protein
MLDQRLSTIPQTQWISKLFGYDFCVEYKPGKLNTVADALSRRDGEEACIHSISTPTFQLYDQIRAAIVACPTLTALRNNIIAGLQDPDWSVRDSLILKKEKIYIPADSELVHTVLSLAHSNTHEGVQKTLHRLCATFYIDHDRRLISDFVKSCSTCQRN